MDPKLQRILDRAGPGYDGTAKPPPNGKGNSQSSESSESSAVPKATIRRVPPYRPFPLHCLPEPLQGYVRCAARAIGCDPALIALPVLSVVAGCIGGSRAVLLKKGWVEPAVLWTVPVNESGGHKTPGWRAAVAPLMDLQADLFDQHKGKVDEFKRELEKWQTTDAKQRGDKPEKPAEPTTLFTSDATIESVGELLQDNPRGFLVTRDELDGWFGSFTRYKSGGGSDRPQWLELFQAGTLRIDRMTRERRRLFVRRAVVSITGTIQPGVLAKALDKDAMQAGLGARFLMAMPPQKQKVWTENEISKEATNAYRILLENLLKLELDNETKREPRLVGISLVAKERWKTFFNEWAKEQHNAEGEQRAAFSKIEAYAPRLALIHHLVENVGQQGVSSITEPSMVAAIELARWFANEATRIYTTLRESETDRDRRRLLEWIADRPGARCTVKELQRSNSRRWQNSEQAREALQELVKDGFGRWEKDDKPGQGGRRSEWFVMTEKAPDDSDDSTSTPDEGAPDDSFKPQNGSTYKSAASGFHANGSANGTAYRHGETSETSGAHCANTSDSAAEFGNRNVGRDHEPPPWADPDNPGVSDGFEPSPDEEAF